METLHQFYGNLHKHIFSITLYFFRTYRQIFMIWGGMFVLMVYIYLAYDVRALTSTTKVSFESKFSFWRIPSDFILYYCNLLFVASSTNFTGHSNLWNVTSTSSDIFRSTTTFLNIINTSTSSTFYDNTECFQNEPINHFLVITRIQLLPNDNSSSADFKSDLESKLTAIYREAQALRNSSSLNISAIVGELLGSCELFLVFIT